MATKKKSPLAGREIPTSTEHSKVAAELLARLGRGPYEAFVALSTRDLADALSSTRWLLTHAASPETRAAGKKLDALFGAVINRLHAINLEARFRAGVV